ncbi:precorrin-8X methylmutase [Dissulfurirhabdus thermomarina]|uniref:Precorrin-8X methylmutase n=1 Tax=Dissulfurirhabdus thermomarina TaxID=1765737 RepID=A0A6N9TWZ2_DISTH|nr:precorrin-8X methylmutase [Dissulfurirhabdus thermomarina]NDY42996.1 precorrin-8X methylmutase [Dissulfurirhabdus thermomarina]NMX23658.1 precorrin-8X methylmutase [Dissulfurirhabdus thermomarina]
MTASSGPAARAAVTPGGEIEARSLEILARELGPVDLPPGELAVVHRVIHATADFDFARTLRFHPRAVAAGVAAIRSGKSILADVGMVAAGIDKIRLGRFGGSVEVPIHDPACAERAAARGITRAAAAMELGAAPHVGIVAVGNAPTALLRVLDMVAAGAFRPDLVVGVPVGFVSAAESKDRLAGADVPFITALGRKGGSSVAAAAVNALLRLAEAA